MKKYYKIAIIFIVFLLLSLNIRYRINESYIKNFNEQNYVEWKVKLLNIFNIYQPYVAVKNYGDYYHKQAEYDKALEKYDAALKHNMPKPKACDTRINACLTIFKKIDMKNKKEAKELLNKAKQYVDDDDCITLGSSESSKGDAEKLSKEIEQKLSELGEGNGENGDDGDDDDNNDPNNQTSNSKINEVQQSNQNAQQARDKSLGRYQDGYDPYKGQNW